MMFRELDFSQIKAAGWVKEYLNTQATGMTGELGRIGHPFNTHTWDASPEEAESALEHFIGGLNSKNDAWVPFEQTGYWIDGAIRAGHLADNEKLLTLGRSKIYPAIENAQENGFIGPKYLEEGLTWPHAVYFRALMAEYTATKNPAILEALERHFLRRPITDAYLVDDLRIISVRQAAEIESVLWLYEQTGNPQYLQMAEASYEVFNGIFSDDTGALPHCQMRDVTLPGMLNNRKVNRNHGVTYCEICKLAAILHKHTGKEIYKQAAVKAFDKLYRDQMIVDGVISSTEYLNGNEDSWAMHETCLVSDMTWALGYLYMITGDGKYGDWIEDAIFNGGLGCVDDDFKSNQYFSCPNQVVANDNCNHAKFYRGQEWMSYAPSNLLGCCIGNVNRFMPNFAYHAWMQDENRLAAVTYCPSIVSVEMAGNPVTIREITSYPFENTIRFRMEMQEPTEFTLVLRKPQWAEKALVTFNGKPMYANFEKGTAAITQVFQDGDELVLEFTDEIRLIENAGGISIKKGALLYALPVKERTVIQGLREGGAPEFPHYSLYPESDWNYGLKPADLNAEFCPGEIGQQPWRLSENGHRITLKGTQLPNWKLRKQTRIQSRLLPRDPCRWENREAIFTPKVLPVTESTPLGETAELTLVPYCTTRLRIAIFPLIER
jgi:hypothetical protein